MRYTELENIHYLRDRWVALDPRGGKGFAALRNGCVVVDFDCDVGDLCARLETQGRSSLEILYCAAPETLS
ncbi:MAG TPA: hypothetical protein VGQ83_21145 [Polyangia bacterium]|jgi:hypothetical protein